MSDNERSWNNIIGDFFKEANSTAVKNAVNKTFYMTILKVKDELLEFSADPKMEDIESYLDAKYVERSPTSNPFYQYENVKMAMNPKKKNDPDRYYYIGDRTKKEKDKKTGETVSKKVKNDKIPIKKFTNLTIETKIGLGFLLSKYLKEAQICYQKNEHSFGDASQIKNQVSKFSRNNIDLPIAPAIIAIVEIVDPESIIGDTDHGKLGNTLVDKIKIYFKDRKDRSPNDQLQVLVDTFVQFLKVMAIFMADLMYEKRQAVNPALLFGTLRILNSLLRKKNVKFEEQFLDTLREYIDQTKPPKKSGGKKGGKKKKDDDDLSGDDSNADEMDDEDTEENGEEEKSNSSKGKEKAKRKPGRPPKQKTSPKKATEEPDDDEEQDTHTLEKALDGEDEPNWDGNGIEADDDEEMDD